MSDETAISTTASAALPGVDFSNQFSNSGNLALQIWFNEALFERTKQIATYLSKAVGIVPPHLIGKPETCFAVVSRALVWKLDPFAVAQSTYSPAEGKIGYEGRLCQAILEASGKIVGGVQFEHFWSVVIEYRGKQHKVRSNSDRAKRMLEDAEAPGVIVDEFDWSNVQAKFKKIRSDKGKEYPTQDWNPAHEAGLGVTVSAQVKGEARVRKLDFELVQAFPRNSTLWATDPMTQICYTAVRRFANVAVPALFMGVPFEEDAFGGGQVIDVEAATPPRPTRGRPAQTPAPMVEEVEDAVLVEESVTQAVLAILATETTVALNTYMVSIGDDVAQHHEVEAAFNRHSAALQEAEAAIKAKAEAAKKAPAATKAPEPPPTETPEPTRTPSPTTPAPTETAEPTRTPEPTLASLPPRSTPAPTAPPDMDALLATIPNPGGNQAKTEVLAMMSASTTLADFDLLWKLLLEKAWGDDDDVWHAYKLNRGTLSQAAAHAAKEGGTK